LLFNILKLLFFLFSDGLLITIKVVVCVIYEHITKIKVAGNKTMNIIYEPCYILIIHYESLFSEPTIDNNMFSGVRGFL